MKLAIGKTYLRLQSHTGYTPSRIAGFNKTSGTMRCTPAANSAFFKWSPNPSRRGDRGRYALMTTSLTQQCEECREAILTAIVDSLQERSDYIASIDRTQRGEIPVSGIALELFPWYGGLGLSLRLTSDFPMGNSRYDSADWTHFDFTNGCKSPSIEAAISTVTRIYNRGKSAGNDLRDMAHLTFFAGSEALLHPKVFDSLNELGINAPLITDRFVTSAFQYIVTDADETVKSNYCDIVLANRVAQRVLEDAA
jgi:hypothetical protein